MKPVVIAIALILAAACPDSSRADSMHESMTDYFRGERLGGAGFVTIGTGSLVAGGLLATSSSDFSRGMSYPSSASARSRCWWAAWWPYKPDRT